MVKQTEVVCKNEANIFVAQDVLKRVDEYNTGLERNKSTKDARGFWQLEIIVGPYPTRHLARAFLKRWQNSRGILPRRERAIKLVQQEVKESLLNMCACACMSMCLHVRVCVCVCVCCS